MADSAPSKVKETRLLLIGRTGSGKSSTGNSILGDKVFKTSLSLSSSTTTTSYEERHRGDRRLVVVDTPGFFDTDKSNLKIDLVQEISKVFGYLSSGFHALLFVVSPERFTKESVKSKELFYRTFGDDVKKYTILVLTNYDRIQDEGVTDVQDYIKHSGPEFTALYDECSKRLVTFNNKATGANMERQVRYLLDMVDKIYRDNYGNVYSNFHFRITRALTKIERRKKRDKKARMKLFTKVTRQLGMENSVVWDSECDRPMRVNAMEVQKGQHMTVPVRSVHKPSGKIKAIPVKLGTQSLKITHNAGDMLETENQTEASRDHKPSGKNKTIPVKLGTRTLKHSHNAGDILETDNRKEVSKVNKHSGNTKAIPLKLGKQTLRNTDNVGDMLEMVNRTEISTCHNPSEKVKGLPLKLGTQTLKNNHNAGDISGPDNQTEDNRGHKHSGKNKALPLKLGTLTLKTTQNVGDMLHVETENRIEASRDHKHSGKTNAIPVKLGTQSLKNTHNVGDMLETDNRTEVIRLTESPTPDSTRENDDSKEELFHKITQEDDSSKETVMDDLFLQDLEDEIDLDQDLDDEADQDLCRDSDEIIENRRAVTDPNIFKRLVNFLTVFIENLVRSR